MRRLTLVALCMFALSACSPAERQRRFGLAYGSNYKVTLYSGGAAVRTWKTVGKITSEGQSDGYFFEDAETKKLVDVAGTVVIEQE